MPIDKFTVQLETISAAKLFATAANSLKSEVLVKSETSEMLNGKSIVDLLTLDLHSKLFVYVDKSDIIGVQNFIHSIQSYIVPESLLQFNQV